MSAVIAVASVGATIMACQCASISPGINIRPPPAMTVTGNFGSIAMSAVDTMVMTLPTISTFDAALRVSLLPSNTRTFWNSVAVMGWAMADAQKTTEQPEWPGADEESIGASCRKGSFKGRTGSPRRVRRQSPAATGPLPAIAGAGRPLAPTRRRRRSCRGRLSPPLRQCRLRGRAAASPPNAAGRAPARRRPEPARARPTALRGERIGDIAAGDRIEQPGTSDGRQRHRQPRQDEAGGRRRRSSSAAVARGTAGNAASAGVRADRRQRWRAGRRRRRRAAP